MAEPSEEQAIEAQAAGLGALSRLSQVTPASIERWIPPGFSTATTTLPFVEQATDCQRLVVEPTKAFQVRPASDDA